MPVSRCVSRTSRAAIAVTIASIEGSRAGESMASGYPIGMASNPLDPWEPSRYAFCGTFAIASWKIAICSATALPV